MVKFDELLKINIHYKCLIIAVWESDMSAAFLRSRLKCPIEPAFF